MKTHYKAIKLIKTATGIKNTVTPLLEIQEPLTFNWKAISHKERKIYRLQCLLTKITRIITWLRQGKIH
jgi:hypothetical protein